MSGTHQTPNNPSHSTFRRGYALDRTKQLLLRGPQGGENILVQPAPTVHPERLIPELIDAHDLKIVFIAPTDTQLKRMKRRCGTLNLSTREISSPYHKCPTYTGKHGDKAKEKLKSATKQVPLGRLHKTRDLPCCPNCPFTSWKRPDFTEQVVLANPRHVYIGGLLEKRVVFTCALRGDAYITEIENPPRALDSYLDKNTGFTGYRDFIRNRDSDRAPSIWDYAGGTIDPSTDDEEFGYAIDKDGHHLAPQIVFGLQHAIELGGNSWDTSFHHYDYADDYDIPTNRPLLGGGDPFDIAGVDYYRTRVVRQPGDTPEDDTIYVLEVPNFSKAESVVAFDVAPTPWMWRTYYGVNFDHQRVYSDAETAEFLRDEMGVEVVQTATSRKPYEGKNVTPGRDASIAVWATAEFGKPPIVVSTKNALGCYRSKQPDLLTTDAKDGIQYRRGGSVITNTAPLVILNGSPRPPNEEFQLWGALAGKSVPDSPNQQGSFGQVGDEIRRQFCESRVGKWATRFDSPDGVVILNTTAVPEWLQDSRLVTRESPTKTLPENAPGRRAVARYLRDNETRVTMDEIQTGADVSENTARRARDSLLEQRWVAKHPTKGREPTEYSWVA